MTWRCLSSASNRIGVDRDIFDPDGFLGPVLPINLDRLHLGQGGQALVPDDAPKDGVEAVQVRRLVEGDEELRAVGPGPLVGHGHDAPRGVSQRRPDLVLERAPPDAASALGILRGVRCRGSSGLDHELGDEAVEGRLIVVARRAEGEEVLVEKGWWLAKEGRRWIGDLPRPSWGRFRSRPRS